MSVKASGAGLLALLCSIAPPIAFSALGTAQPRRGAEPDPFWPGRYWSIELTHELEDGPEFGPVHAGPTIGPDGLVYVGDCHGIILAVSQKGEIVWGHRPVDCDITGMVAGQDRLYVASSTGTLHCVAHEGSHLEWSFDSGGPIWRPPVLGPDGELYIASDSGWIYRVDTDGRERWRRAVPEVAGGICMAPDNTLRVVAGRALLAIKRTGRIRWAFEARSFMDVPPVVSPDGVTYIGCESGYVYALDANGAMAWERPLKASVAGGIAVSEDGTVYAGCSKGYLYAIQAGSRKWKALLGDRALRGTPVIGPGNEIVVSVRGRGLIAFDASGDILWQRAIGAAYLADLAGSRRMLIALGGRLTALGRKLREGAVEGTVLAPDRLPVGGVRIKLERNGVSIPNGALTTEQGQYTVTDLKQGEYVLKAKGGPFGKARAEFRLSPEERRRVDVILDRTQRE